MAENPFQPLKMTTNNEEKLVRRLTRMNAKASKVHAKFSEGSMERWRLFQMSHPELREFYKKKPIFFERSSETDESFVFYDEKLKEALPREFFDDPTGWIEAQPSLYNSSVFTQEMYDTLDDEQIQELELVLGDSELVPGDGILRHDIDAVREVGVYADIDRLKKFQALDNVGNRFDIISKRVNPKHADFSEAALATEAREAGIPIPRILALIEHHGNKYIFFERIPSKSLLDLYAEGLLEPLYKNEKGELSVSPTRHEGSQKDLYIKEKKTRLYVTAQRVWSELSEREQRRLSLLMKGFVFIQSKMDDLKKEFSDSFNLKLRKVTEEMRSENGDLRKEFASAVEEKLTETSKEARLSLEQLGKLAGVDPMIVVEEGIREVLYHWASKYDDDAMIAIRRDLDISKESLFIFYDSFQRLQGKILKEEEDSFPKLFLQNAVLNAVRDILAMYELGKGNISERIYMQIEELRERCRAAGIEHKDLEWRNILIECDPKSGKVLKDKDGKFKLWIIDWEQHEEGKHTIYRHKKYPKA